MASTRPAGSGSAAHVHGERDQGDRGDAGGGDHQVVELGVVVLPQPVARR